jgi:hypothetical protein
MNFTRAIGFLTIAATLGLAACGGGGNVNTVSNPNTSQTSSTVNYTGPAPASPDVQAFEINLWANINSTNRCGGCHNATTPAQMPNFARTDNVNLAYAQANTVVNLQQPSTSLMVTKVGGGHNCWLADPSACASILTTWISNWASAANGGTSTSTVQLVAPPVQSVGASLNLPNDGGAEYQATIYTITSVCAAIAVFRGSCKPDRRRLSGRDPEDRPVGLRAVQRDDLRRELALLPTPVRRQP